MNKQLILSQLEEQYEVVDVIDTSDWECKFIFSTWKAAEDSLLQVYKESYLPTQRIVIVFDRNKFNNFLSFNNFVEKWQQLINKVDISNFFVIVIHNDSESQILLEKTCKEISADLVSLTFLSFDNDTDKSEKNPTTESTFCVLPWIHLMVQPSGHIHPCCNSQEILGNTSVDTLQDAWNSVPLRKMRLSMINDSYHPACSRCYENEMHSEQSARQRINNMFLHHYDLAEKTNVDGSVDEFNLRYMDIRFSNICNLRCRTCNHHASSRWYADQKKLDPTYDKPIVFKAGRFETDIWKQIEPYLDTVESIYFAGGEPLLTDEHYWILDALEKLKKFDVEIFYSTNFTVLDKTKKHVFDYWKNFKNITVAASLDASGPRAEYLRKDTKWQDIIDNRLLLQKTLPHVKFKIAATLSIINALHLPDFHREWIGLGLINPDDILVNLVFDPDYYKIDIAPNSFKEKIKNRYTEHIDWLKEIGADQNTINSFSKPMSFLKIQANTLKLDEFKNHTLKLDAIRNENILEIFPELNDIFAA